MPKSGTPGSCMPNKEERNLKRSKQVVFVLLKNKMTPVVIALNTYMQPAARNASRQVLGVVVKINGIPVEVEVDSGAERSTIPLSVFKQKLAGTCKLQPSNLVLHQYDKSPLLVAGECHAKITINQCVIRAIFVVVDVQKQVPLLGRDWMNMSQFDVSALMVQATQLHHTSESTLTAELMAEFTDVFQDELGVLKGIEANVSVKESAVPHFHRVRPIPFALREKVEQHLQKQVNEGELIPVDKSDWAIPIVVVRKKDGRIWICGDFKVLINPVIKALVRISVADSRRDVQCTGQ